MNALSQQKLQELLFDFYNLTGMKTSIHDDAQNELCYYPAMRSPFCRLLREHPEMDRKCEDCDRLAYAACRRTHRSFSHVCHAGLTECFSPVLYQGRIIGYIAIGQIRSQNADFSVIRSQLPVASQARLQQAYEQLPLIEPDKIRSAMHILDACTSYEYLKSLVETAEHPIDARISAYIEAHLSDDLSVSALCKLFYVSRNELYGIFRRAFDASVADFVKSRRLHKARDLLAQTALPVAKVAEQCGIADYNYFTKQFKSAFAVTPTAYRRANRT